MNSVTLDVNTAIYLIHAKEGFFRAERRLYPPRLHDRMEA